MSVLLFKLRGVEEDEAEEVRALLSEHDIDFYETSNGRWGLGYAAVWLPDETKLEEAETLIAKYQQHRFEQARQSYIELCANGQQATMWQRFKTYPMQVVLAVMGIIIVGLFALTPFVFL